MAIKVNNKGIIQHYADAFDERGTNFALGATIGTPIAMRKGVPPVPPALWNSVAAIAAPVYEYRFEGDFSNTGTGTAGSIATNNATATASTANTALTGYCDFSGASNAYVSLTGPKSELVWSQDRSYIWAFNIPVGASNSQKVANIAEAGAIPNRFQWNGGGTNLLQYYNGSSFINSTITDAAGIKLIVASYDLASTDITIRWKQTGSAVGSTTHNLAAVSTSGTATADIWGTADLFDASAHENEYAYFAIIDSQVSASDFDSLTSVLGIT